MHVSVASCSQLECASVQLLERIRVVHALSHCDGRRYRPSNSVRECCAVCVCARLYVCLGLCANALSTNTDFGAMERAGASCIHIFWLPKKVAFAIELLGVLNIHVPVCSAVLWPRYIINANLDALFVLRSASSESWEIKFSCRYVWLGPFSALAVAARTRLHVSTTIATFSGLPTWMLHVMNLSIFIFHFLLSHMNLKLSKI